MTTSRPAAAPHAWYRQSFGADYLTRYAHRNRAEAAAAVSTLASRVRLEQRVVLDLACGAGRHIPPLLAHGARHVIGLDLSEALLAVARAELAQAVAAGRARLIHGDMRQIPLPDGEVDVVASFFTSFGYFETDEQNGRVLAEVARVLRPGGEFVLDFLNAPHAIAHLVAEEVREQDGEAYTVRRWFDARTGRLEKRVEAADGTVRLAESVRAYRGEELARLAAAASLELAQALGGYDGSPYDEAASPRYIGVYRKQ